MEKIFSAEYSTVIAMLDRELRLDASFDLVGREIKIDKRSAKLYFIDGFCKDEILEKVMEFIPRESVKTQIKIEKARNLIFDTAVAEDKPEETAEEAAE